MYRLSVNKYLWIVPFFSFLLGYLCMNFLFQGNIVTTPTLIGCSTPEALRLAAQKKLNIRLIDEKEDAELPAGTVISQNPSPHAAMKTHQTILCSISKRSECTVPNLIGKRLEDINKELKGLSIKLKSYYVQSPLPQGTCCAQDPMPGTAFDGIKGIVAYIAQKRTLPYVFPDFRQKTVAEVVEFLVSSGIRFEIRHFQEISSDHTCSDCIVSDQEPSAGTLVPLDANQPLKVQLYATEVEPSTRNVVWI